MRATRQTRSTGSAMLLAVTAALLVAPATAAAEEPAPPTAGQVVVGELVQAFDDPASWAPGEPGHEHAEHDEHGEHEESAGLLSWVQSSDGEAVRVPTQDVDHVSVGSTLQVTVGDPVLDEPAADGLEPALEVLATQVVAPPADVPPVTAPASGPVNHPVTVVMMVPPGASQDATTLTDVVALVNGPVADFWDEQSNGRVQFGVTGTRDWAPSVAGCSDPFALWREAADRAGWTGASNAHLLVHVPQNAPGCSAGLGTVGGGGGRAYVQTAPTSAVTTTVITHEFGHNLGLGHSSQLQCDRTLEVGTCSVYDYGDHYDVMGVSWGEAGTLNTAQADLIGLLPAEESLALTPQSPATPVTLVPVSSAGGLRAVRLRGGSGPDYWVEYRQSSGRDSWLGTSRNRTGMQEGVTVRRSAPGPADTSLVLDGSPSAAGQWGTDRAMALPTGQPVALDGGRFTVTVQGVTAAGARLTVTGGAATVPAGDTLIAGQQLSDDGRLTSADGRYRMVAQADGNLVVYTQDGRVLFASGRYGRGAVVRMQADGNLVSYGTDGRALWNSGTWQHSGARLVLRDDGALVVVTPDGRVVWSTGPDTADTLRAPGGLATGGRLTSLDGRYQLVAQPDGNLVLYAPGNRPLFASGRYGSGVTLRVQPDGNLVSYAADGRALWDSGTWRDAGARLVLQSDGNLVVYRLDGSAAWATGWDTPDTLRVGGELSADRQLTSLNGRYRLVGQRDGNLVVYRSDGRVVFASGRYGGGARTTVQPDGNVVTYATSGQPLWNTGTWGNGTVRLVLGDDGGIRVVRLDGRVVWTGPVDR